MMYSSLATSSSWKRPLLMRKLVSWLFSGIIPASAGGRWSKSHTHLAVARVLDDAVLRVGPADPDEPFGVGNHRLQPGRPRGVPVTAPRTAARCLPDPARSARDRERSRACGAGLPSPPISSCSGALPRFRNQTWSMESTLIPVTCCMLHRLGSGFGQNGSTRYCGAPFSSTACPAITCARPTIPAASASMRTR